jgi:hypothetical protein
MSVRSLCGLRCVLLVGVAHDTVDDAKGQEKVCQTPQQRSKLGGGGNKD